MSQSGLSLRALRALFFLILGLTASAQPHISSFVPFQGPPGTVVDIFGTGLIGPGFVTPGQRVIVEFTSRNGGGIAAQILAGNEFQLRVIVPEGSKTGPISVRTSVSPGSSLPFLFYLPPVVTDFGTETGPLGNFVTPVVGRAGQILRIRGENFIPPAGNLLVQVGGHFFVRTVVSDTQIEVQLGNPAVNGPVETGPVWIASVVGTNVSTEFLYAQPIVGGFTPKAAAGSLVSITGFNLLARSASEVSVKFGGVASPEVTLLSNTNVTALVPLNAISGPITFSAPGGSHITTSNFTVLPSLSSFTPAFGPAGTVVTLNGSGLNGTTQVRFGNVAAAKFTNVTQLQVTVEAPPNLTTGPITVTTTNGVAVSAANFYGVPRIDTFLPQSGDPTSIVSLSGLNFIGTSQVLLNGVAVPDFLVLNNQQLTFAVPANATSGKIKVVAPGGSDETATSFTVRGPEPTINSFTPTSGGPGTQVVITGLNLTTATNVTFNGVDAVFTRVQQTNLQATVPATATTGPIRVATPAGASQTTANFVVGTTADVRITYTGTPQPAVAYGLLTYSLQAFNNGPLPAQNTVIEFTIPASTSLIDATGSVVPQINGSKITYNRGQMDPGNVFTGTIRVSAGPPTNIVAFGRIQTSTADTNSANNQRYLTNTVALPQLGIESVDALGVLLSWPSAAGPLYQLKSTAELDLPFVPVAGNAVDDGAQLQLVIPATNALRWFRLELLGQ